MAKRIYDAQEAQEELALAFDEAKHAVFFGGAGVSTASGIPDFRSVDGLYNQQFDYPPEMMLSHTFYEQHTSEFYDFYRKKMIALDAKPNQAHYKLAELEAEGKLSSVITQNIDGLHQMAGSKNVFELHGSVHRNICYGCNSVYSAEWILDTEGVPVCPKCGGSIKPDVVLYEEPLRTETIIWSQQEIAQADLLVIGGTSLVVYPAAGLVRLFNGRKLIICNLEPTPQDAAADVVISCDIAKAFNF